VAEVKGICAGMVMVEPMGIIQEQLVAEVKSIYAGLVMVKSKCIEVDNAQYVQQLLLLNNESGKLQFPSPS
jgi:hypothetical protein